MFIWYVNRIDPNIPSCRHRAIWMSQTFAEEGNICLVTDDTNSVALTKKTHAVIISNAFNEKALEVAWGAYNSGIPVFIDLCDDIFSPKFSEIYKCLMLRRSFYKIVKIATAIITPTEALKKIIQKKISTAINISVIPDEVRNNFDSLSAKLDTSKTKIKISKNLTLIRKSDSYQANTIPAAVRAIISFIMPHIRPLNYQETNLLSIPSLSKYKHSDEGLVVSWKDVITKAGIYDRDNRMTILIVLDLIQDLEVIKPLLLFLSSLDNIQLNVLITKWLQKNSARVNNFLNSVGIMPSVLNGDKILRDYNLYYLNRVDTILLPSESNLAPHKIAHHIANMAVQKKIRTITFQHGIENIGLSYFDSKHVNFASDIIITWNDAVQNDYRIDPQVKSKCIPLGMFKEIDQGLNSIELQNKIGFNKVVGVFENLHWERYTKKYKKEFIASLVNAAKSRNEVCFLVKPHHAGKWLSSHGHNLIRKQNNIMLINLRDPFWEQYAGNQLVSACDAIITTPSTIAIDAALSETPVAVVANDIKNLKYYEPLQFLSSTSDWLNFIDAALSNSNHENKTIQTFKNITVRKLNPTTEFVRIVLNL